MIGCLFFALRPAQSEDWPQHLGPNRNGHSGETGLAKSWPETGPKALWTFPLGIGFAGPAIRDGEVYLLDRVNDEKDVLRCFALDTGQELWNFESPAPGKISHNGSRTVPTVDETHIYTVGMLGKFYALSRTTHQAVWQKDLAAEYPPVDGLTWGYAQSPSLYKNLVIVAPQNESAFVVAFDKETGDVVWKTGGVGVAGYSTPVIHPLVGMDQVVMVSGGPSGGVMGLSVEEGRQLWRYEGWHCKYPIPHATLLPEDRLFITGEYGAGSALIQIKRDGDAFTVTELALLPDVESQIHPPLLIKDHLYLNCNGNRRNDGMACLDLEGKVLWKTKDTPGAPMFERGGLIFADGMILNFDGKTGILHLIDPSPDGYKELARAQIFDSREMWSPMALSGGKLVLRSQNELKCLDLKAP
ncbi:MAG: PQQ-binding-like beta-propeller repeat protein [Candidatus Hydrogenedentes bacterium]|nr:PQQ-binding-like beta-propeller repeat protein [Candidatus Hydrogenedentota bacterium]